MFKIKLNTNLKRSKMQNKQISTKESLYFVYAYVSTYTFLLLGISKITENLERALAFNPIVSVVIVLNMAVFISLYFYKETHSTHGKHNHF